jgi:hypothetical protein
MKLSDLIKPVYFWDICIPDDAGRISRRLIIERIFSLGCLDEIRFIISYYGRDEVLKERVPEGIFLNRWYCSGIISGPQKVIGYRPFFGL